MALVILITIILIALVFEFINGFHDTANVVATPIATRSLSPHQAIVIAAIFNFAGAFMGTGVASTINKGLVDSSLVTHLVLIAALTSAISWNLITWGFSIPSSSSHALIGSLAGAVIATDGLNAVRYTTLIDKVVIPMIVSPILTFFIAFIIILLVMRILLNNKNPRQANNFIRELQVLSSSLLALSHGSNDSQKTMSIITLALFSFGLLKDPGHIPAWVIVLCALAMALGTLSGGMKIIRTLSTRVAKLRPANGFAAEMSSGLLILAASRYGLPVSTTQAATGSIMGAGYTGSNINWSVVRSMITAWILTLPCCMFLGGLIFKILHIFFGRYLIALAI